MITDDEMNTLEYYVILEYSCHWSVLDSMLDVSGSRVENGQSRT